jgi:hypothetical protein
MCRGEEIFGLDLAVIDEVLQDEGFLVGSSVSEGGSLFLEVGGCGVGVCVCVRECVCERHMAACMHASSVDCGL